MRRMSVRPKRLFLQQSGQTVHLGCLLNLERGTLKKLMGFNISLTRYWAAY